MYELKDKKKEGTRKPIWKKAAACVMALILFFICSAMLYVTKLASTIQKIPDADIKEIKNDNLKEETEEKMGGYWTVAIFGVDSRDGNLGRGTNAATQMVLTVKRDSGEIRLASVYRDTLLMSNVAEGKCRKINSSYAEGGPEQAVTALNENLDLDIMDYVSFSWSAAADAVNLLGGIDMDITKAEYAYINSFITETVERTGIPSVHLTGPGLTHLDGVQAVAYCRLRLMDTDMQRTERQRKVIEAVLEKLKTADLATINRLLETVLPQVSTSITMADGLSLGKNAGKYHMVKTEGFPQEYGTATIGKLGHCVIPNTLETNVAGLHKFLYEDEDYQISDRVREIGREIVKQAVGE